MPITHQQQLGLHHKGEPVTREEMVLTFWTPQDVFFIKAITLSTADLIQRKKHRKQDKMRRQRNVPNKRKHQKEG